MMFAWKNETFVKTWRYLQGCAAAVKDPGYIINPWGRMRRFPKTNDDKLIQSMGREAMNAPIQSTVADCAQIAMQLMAEYRKQHGLKFKIVNQIHDAIMVETPIEEIDDTKQMFLQTMGNIEIPMKSGRPLKLGVDIEVLSRWGERYKPVKKEV